ncbi:hypothetical protein AAFF_G00199030 [Aldrovandia affinis]|uniref:Methyltransferase-like 26 B n=1 Tax=Aldrovandia affinis TaxID=143900 RepID=A0AAD7RIU1_9TELE|nr:hypothetical protein AAFF_G00199030 [Aldrovandia affinis]
MLLSPAAERNQDSLLSVLWDQLEEQPQRELFALELGSGTGQHVVHFAQDLPFVTWQPSDITEEFRTSIRAYIAATKSSCDVIVSINMLHYCSFGTIEGVFQGSGQILRKDGFLMTYGPYAINGIIIPSSNEDLDRTLREKNPEWGLPDVDVLRQLAFDNGMRLERMIEMPESNKCLIFRKM